MTETGTGWTPEQKEEVVEAYTSRSPTPENTIEIIEELVEEFGKTKNGIRIILSKAGVYIKKAPVKKSNGSSGGSKRVNKKEALEKLTQLIEAKGCNVDEDIINKLTGKAANYIAEILETVEVSEID